MKLKIFTVTVLATIVLAACGKESINEGNSSKENATQNVKELVSDYSAGKIKASLRQSLLNNSLLPIAMEASQSMTYLKTTFLFLFHLTSMKPTPVQIIA